MISIKTRSSCVVSNCRTHDTVEGLPDYLNQSNGHYNCSTAHPCLECLKCPDCKSGKAYHSSNHGEWKPQERKTRVVLTESQKQEIRQLAQSGATPKDLSIQFNAGIRCIYKALATFKKV